MSSLLRFHSEIESTNKEVAVITMPNKKPQPFRWEDPESLDVSILSEVMQHANGSQASRARSEDIPVLPGYLPLVVDRQIWEIAKRVKVDHPEEIVYWAEVVKLYKEMGGRIEIRPMPPSP
jgi:hypothetical protein